MASSQAAAPANIPSMSRPCKAAGSRPTADSSLVRPPTQSYMGNRASQPSLAAVWSIFEPDIVIATACLGKSSPAAWKASATREHAVAGFRRPAALGGDHAKRFRELAVQPTEGAIDAVRVRVVDEVHPHLVRGRLAEGVGDEHRAQCRPADSDAKHAGISLRLHRSDLSRMDSGGERLDVRDGLANLGGDFRSRGQVRVSQPVVPDHPVLVRVCDGPLLQFVHRPKGGHDRRGQMVEELRRRTACG